MASTSKVSEFIRSHPVFTTRELLAACGDVQGSRNLLHLAKGSGRVRQVRRGLYVSSAGGYVGSTPPFQAIAAKAAPDATLCHASAFSLFLGSQDVVAEASFYTGTASRPFTFDGVRYVPVPMPRPPVEARSYQLLGGFTVLGTTKERTVADALASPGRSGGVEAVLRRLAAVRYVDVDELVGIAVRLGPSACARLGWVLERRREQWRVADDAFALIRSAMGRGPYRFGSVHGGSSFDPAWRLILQEDEATMEGWLDG